MTPDDLVRAANSPVPEQLAALTPASSALMQHAVAAACWLHGANPRHEPGTSWATAVGALRLRASTVALDRRVRDVVEVDDWDRLLHGLHALLGRVCAPHRAGLDYVELAEDLSAWQSSAAEVRQKWGRDFARAASGPR